MNDSITDLLGERENITKTTSTMPVLEQTLTFDEPLAPEGSAILPPKALRNILSRLNRRELDVSKPPEPIFSLNGQCFATEGNVSTFSALSKAGKSAVTGGMIAATLCGSGDTLGFSSQNTRNQALICIDTEQSDYHHDKKMLAAVGRRGYGLPGDPTKKPIPDWLAPYALSGEVLDLVWLEAIMWAEDARCGGIHSVILDGVADFIGNVNDPEESKAMVAGLMKLAKQYNCHILGIIHLNPSGAETGKTRGHLGSELERKAESNLTIKVTERDRVVYARSARDCHIPESKGTRFQWCDAAGTFVTSSNGGDGEGFGILDVLEYIHLTRGSSASKKNAQKDFVDQYGCSARNVNRYIKEAKDQKFLIESGRQGNVDLTITKGGQDYLKTHGRLDNPPA